MNGRVQRLISAVKEKKYTEDHEWIEASADGKTCTFVRVSSNLPCDNSMIEPPKLFRLTFYQTHSVSQSTLQRLSVTSFTSSFRRLISKLERATQLVPLSPSSPPQTSSRPSAEPSLKSIRSSRTSLETSTRTLRVVLGLPRSLCQRSLLAS
jgi:hypothetical protein